MKSVSNWPKLSIILVSILLIALLASLGSPLQFDKERVEANIPSWISSPVGANGEYKFEVDRCDYRLVGYGEVTGAPIQKYFFPSGVSKTTFSNGDLLAMEFFMPITSQLDLLPGDLLNLQGMCGATQACTPAQIFSSQTTDPIKDKGSGVITVWESGSTGLTLRYSQDDGYEGKANFNIPGKSLELQQRCF